MKQFDIKMVNELMVNRRSIFPADYSTEPVPKFVIDQMLENANWAPTHRFTQPWRFTIFHKKGIERLANFQAGLYKRVTESNQQFDERKYQQLLEKPLKCSHIISIGMHRDPEKSVPEIEEIAAVAMAVQNMHLTASAYGVGCYWGTGGITYMEEAKPFFQLGNEDKLMGFLFVGMPKRKWPEGRRSPVKEKIKWIED